MRDLVSQCHRDTQPELSLLLKKYPRTGGALLQTYSDITLAQGWKDVKVFDLEECERGIISGVRAEDGENSDPRLLVPCSISESISISWVKAIFKGLSNPKEVYLAVNAADSSIVYYKIGDGIVKPSDFQ